MSAPTLNDRVKETTNSTGTGTINLNGTTPGFQTFDQGIGSGSNTFYCISSIENTEWEVGWGIVGTNILVRNQVYRSSNANTFVNFSAGEKDVFVPLPSSKAIIRDVDSQDINFGASITASALRITGGAGSSGSIYKSSTTGLTLFGARGSLFDFEIAGPTGADIMQIPTGSINVIFSGDVTASNFKGIGTQLTGVVSSSYALTASLVNSVVKLPASSSVEFNGRSNIQSPADGNILLQNSTRTGFSLLQFGGTDGSFTALKAASDVLFARYADDSGNCLFHASRIVSDGDITSGGSVGVLSGDAVFSSNAWDTVSTTPVPIALTAVSPQAGITVVVGADSSNKFADLVFWSKSSTSVILSHTLANAPAARTYSAVSNRLYLAMASGTYTVSTAVMMNAFAGFSV